MISIPLPFGTSIRVDESVVSIVDPFTGGTITVHRNLARSRLIEQWKNKPAFLAILDGIMNEIQLAENACFEVIASRAIDYAEGVNLDTIGDIVGQLREGRTDSVYRLWLKARIRANRSFGEATDLIEVLQLLAAPAFTLQEVYPAGFYIEFGLPPADLDVATQWSAILNETRGAGISLSLTVPTSEGDFQFSTSSAGDASVEHGWGDSGGADVGGFWSFSA